MTQKRYFDYQSPQTAWTDAQQFMGVLEPGRYRGFDAIAGINPTSLTLSHSNSKALKSTKVDGTASNNIGVWLTKQGIVVLEDASLTIAASTFDNTAMANKRIFAIYGEHLHANSIGGSAATYGVKAGDTSGNYPTLDFPLKQVLLLYVIIPAGQGANGAGVKVELGRPKGLGNEDAALLQYINTFTMMQEWAQSPDALSFASNNVTIPSDNLKGNTFRSTPDDYLKFITKKDCKPGTKLVLFNSNAIDTYQYILQSIAYEDMDNTEYANGKRPIYLGKGSNAIDAAGTGLIDSWAVKWPGQGIAVFELVDAIGTEKQYWHLTFVTSLWEEIYNLKNNSLSLLLNDMKWGLDPLNPPTYSFTEESDTRLFRFPLYNDPEDNGSGIWSYQVPNNNYKLGPGGNKVWVRVSYVIPLSYSSHTANDELQLWLTKNCVASPTQAQIESSLFKCLGFVNNENTIDRNLTFDGSILVPISLGDKLDLYFWSSGKINQLILYTSPTGIQSLTFEVVSKQIG
jgi:hypothetical protein